jgi:sterol 24-C-methyltransferase
MPSPRALAQKAYRIQTLLRSLRFLWTLPPERFDAFMASYALYDHDWADPEAMQAAFGPDYVREVSRRLVDYYGVLNHLCALGEVEKMYIPPTLDLSRGIVDNQLLFERRLFRDLGVGPGSRVLDVGCGRGRVAAHLAAATGAHVTGINVDPDQLRAAAAHAADQGLGHLLDFRFGDVNELPFDFPDGRFDAIYHVQVFSLSRDLGALFRDLARLLRPGGTFACLDWVVKDAYDPDDPHHASLMRRLKPLIGAIGSPSVSQYVGAMERAGFEVSFQQDLSVDGRQSPLIRRADRYYTTLNKVITLLHERRLVPGHLKPLFDRLSKDGGAFVEADELGLATSSWYAVAARRAGAGYAACSATSS